MTKFNPETCHKIIQALEAGNYRKTAAALAGVSERTFYSWIKKAESHKTGKYVQFLQSVKKAEEKAKAYHLQQIRKASENGSWQASAWYLERKHPQEWGRRQQIDMDAQVKAKVDSNVKVNLHDEIKEAEDYFESINKQRKGSDMEDNPSK